MRAMKRRLDRVSKTAVSIISQKISARQATMSSEELEAHNAMIMGKLKAVIETGYVTIEQVRAQWPNLVRVYFDEDTGKA